MRVPRLNIPLRVCLPALFWLLTSAALRGAPTASTQFATEIRPTTAKLNGMAVPNSAGTSAWFEWGPRGAYDQTTTATNIGTGTAVVRVQSAVSGLTNSGTYQFRLVTSNATGVAYGAIQLFT